MEYWMRTVVIFLSLSRQSNGWWLGGSGGSDPDDLQEADVNGVDVYFFLDSTVTRSGIEEQCKRLGSNFTEYTPETNSDVQGVIQALDDLGISDTVWIKSIHDPTESAINAFSWNSEPVDTSLWFTRKRISGATERKEPDNNDPCTVLKKKHGLYNPITGKHMLGNRDCGSSVYPICIGFSPIPTTLPSTTLPPTTTEPPTTVPTTTLPPTTTVPSTTVPPTTTLPPTTVPPTTLPPTTTESPTTVPSTTLPPTTTAPSTTTLPPTTTAPSTTTLPPTTTEPPTTLPPTTSPPTTALPPTTAPPTTLPPTTTVPPITLPPTTTEPPTTLQQTTASPPTTVPPTTLPPTTLQPTTSISTTTAPTTDSQTGFTITTATTATTTLDTTDQTTEDQCSTSSTTTYPNATAETTHEPQEKIITTGKRIQKKSVPVLVCPCQCPQILNNNLPSASNISQTEFLLEKTNEIQKNLTVTTSDLSTTVRKKTSAKDSRSSSKIGGVLAIALVSLVFGILVISDVMMYSRYKLRWKT